jgi:hypothetical protein
MHYGKNRTTKFSAILYFGIVMGLFYSCSPHRRFARLLRNHPYLLQVQVRDSFVVREGKVIDTTLLIKETHDTIRYAGTTIIRSSDTFRFITRIEPCTTFIQKREIILPKERKETGEKRSKWEIYQIISFIVICVLLTLSLFVNRR